MDNKKKIGAIACGVIGLLALLIGLLYPKGNKIYKVAFDTAGGSDVLTQEVKENDMVTRPADPTKDDYVFVRWDLDNQEYDFTSKVTRDITLRAIWNEVQHYKVTFVVNGDIKDLDVTSTSGLDVSQLGYPEKSGYELKWYVDGKEYDISTPISSDMKIEGKYVKVTTLTVKFDSKGGSSVKSQSVKSGETATEPTGVTYAGYILSGWYLNNNKYDFSTPVTKSITLVAKWEEDPDVKRYTVSFDSNGGSKVASQKVIENKTASTPKTPTKIGYVFVEWQLDGKKYDFKTKVTDDIALKAVWEEEIKYTVTFNDYDGSKISSVEVVKGKKVSKPSSPTRSGYTFSKWLYNGSAFDFNTAITEDITLTASYTQNAVATPTPTPSSQNYTIKTVKANPNDHLSNYQVYLNVYKNNELVSYREIRYTDGVHLCNSGEAVQTASLEDSTYTVILSNGSSVRATLN